jgi:hypothetical protein
MSDEENPWLRPKPAASSPETTSPGGDSVSVPSRDVIPDWARGPNAARSSTNMSDVRLPAAYSLERAGVPTLSRAQQPAHVKLSPESDDVNPWARPCESAESESTSAPHGPRNPQLSVFPDTGTGTGMEGDNVPPRSRPAIQTEENPWLPRALLSQEEDAEDSWGPDGRAQPLLGADGQGSPTSAFICARCPQWVTLIVQPIFLWLCLGLGAIGLLPPVPSGEVPDAALSIDAHNRSPGEAARCLSLLWSVAPTSVSAALLDSCSYVVVAYTVLLRLSLRSESETSSTDLAARDKQFCCTRARGPVVRFALTQYAIAALGGISVWALHLVDRYQGLSGVIVGDLGYLLTALALDRPLRCRTALATVLSLLVYAWFARALRAGTHQGSWPADLIFFTVGIVVQLLLHHADGGRTCCCCCDGDDGEDADIEAYLADRRRREAARLAQLRASRGRGRPTERRAPGGRRW